jgi:hypothetical protein
MIRDEAQEFLESPDKLTDLTMSWAGDAATINITKGTDSLAAFRRVIFASRRGQCLSEESIRELYHPEDAEAISCETLAHIVSCSDCLESVNRLLHLAPLSERCPADTIDREGPSGPPAGPGGSGGGRVDQIKRCCAAERRLSNTIPRSS